MGDFKVTKQDIEKLERGLAKERARKNPNRWAIEAYELYLEDQRMVFRDGIWNTGAMHETDFKNLLSIARQIERAERQKIPIPAYIDLLKETFESEKSLPRY